MFSEGHTLPAPPRCVKGTQSQLNISSRPDIMMLGQWSPSLPVRKSSNGRARSMSPKKATEILNTLISDAAYLESEPFESSKRSQWAETSRAVLERAFDSNSSILDSFGTAQSIAFGGHDPPEQLRQHANATLSSTVAVLRSAVEQ